jgi:hypothetical protein
VLAYARKLPIRKSTSLFALLVFIFLGTQIWQNGCGLMEADTGIKLTIENLGGPYSVDIAYTDKDPTNAFTTDVVISTVPSLIFSLGTDYQIASNPGFSGLLTSGLTGIADYYVTGYSVSYQVVTANNVSSLASINDILVEHSGGIFLHIVNGEAFSSGSTSGTLIQVIRTGAQEDLVDLASATTGGLEIDVIATITFTGHTEDNRTFALKGSFDIKFREIGI